MRNWDPFHTYLLYKRFRKTGKFNASPPLVLAMGVLVLIVLGSVLLYLPIATTRPISYGLHA